MSALGDPMSQFSISSEDIARWEEEARHEDTRAKSLASQAAESTEKAALLRFKAQKARELAALILGDVNAPIPAAPGPTTESQREPSREGAYRKGSWRDGLRNWIYASPTGLSSADLREIINADVDFGPKFAESDKGYYHALSHLKAEKVIVQDNGRYYSPKAFADHLAAVARGEVKDAPRRNYRYSPMAEAILDLIRARPGIAGGEIVKVLRANEEFAESLRLYNSGVYNVLARLEGRQQVRREDGGYTPGPQMPARDPRSKWSRIGAELAGATANTQQGEFHLN